MCRIFCMDVDFQVEIEVYLQFEIDVLMDEGLSFSEVECEVKWCFGNVMCMQEIFYEGNCFFWFDNFRCDVILVLCQLWGVLFFIFFVFVLLILVIGLNGVVFFLVDQMFMCSLFVEDLEGFVQFEWDGQFVGQGMGNIGFGRFIFFLLYCDFSECDDVFLYFFV